ncbi:testis development-related protein-like [Trichosurus vulpecula]|uniref:testis development-related protein-like n=1 Tax=Trichosurus vulpecula TaxID=9337 RepID=UPI00186AF07B|nr:testis development-related protein-like [Trichosurus vulpecula]
MWKLNKSKALPDDFPKEEESQGEGKELPPPQAAPATASSQSKDQLLQDEITSSVSQLATKVQGASFQGWKEVTSMFNKDDEQQLIEKCKSPKFKGTKLRITEYVNTEKKSGFWDSLVLKQNVQSRKPDEIEGWELPRITLEYPATDVGDSSRCHLSCPGWEDETKGSTKYTGLTSSGNSSGGVSSQP